MQLGGLRGRRGNSANTRSSSHAGSHACNCGAAARGTTAVAGAGAQGAAAAAATCAAAARPINTPLIEFQNTFRYRDALTSMTEAQSNFATALADFGCGSDEDSLIMGALEASGASCQRHRDSRAEQPCEGQVDVMPLWGCWGLGHVERACGSGAACPAVYCMQQDYLLVADILWYPVTTAVTAACGVLLPLVPLLLRQALLSCRSLSRPSGS